MTDLSVLTLCSRAPIDRTLLVREGRAFRSIEAPKLRRYVSWRTLLLPLQLPLALLQAFLVIRRARPQVILTGGGPVTVPACLAARLLGVPIVLLDLDASGGLANHLCERFATAICLGQEEEENVSRVSPHPRRVVTGVPVRSEILRGSLDAGRAITGFSGKRPVLLVLGGSQGAQPLNDVMHAVLADLLELCDVAHVTGPGKGDPRCQHARYWQREFVIDELPHLLSLATIVLSRAGASAIAEMAALGKPTILVPLPHAAQDHQRRNAKRLALRGAAITIGQGELHSGLIPLIRALLDDPVRLRTLGDSLRASVVPDAAERVARVLLDTTRSPS